ncbi:hypothetical protein [Pseudomonas sp. FW300-N1A1]|uniref:hypothetical protein n=1 Tax=Pseudomonas sp. FW300-N1A1 TaxID=2075555 RepID=UPI0011AF235D|nr:hypothetical protein [Pseudomonas sp. FW300-N1A1]
MRWLELESPAGKKIPRWKRSIGVASNGGVYVPAAAGGNEQEVVLCTAYDGTTYVNYLNHAFVLSTWLKREFPESTDVCLLMEVAVQRALANATEQDDQ